MKRANKGKLLYLPTKQTDIIKTLDEAQKSRQLLTIRLKQTGDDEFDVYVLSRSGRFVLGSFMNDFYFDGYFIINTGDVVSAKPFNDLYTFICRKDSGPACFITPEVDLASWSSVLSSEPIKGRIVSVEGIENGEDYRLYGLVSEVYKSSFIFSAFDLNGEWDADFELGYEEISSLFFDTRYSKRWQEHLSCNRVYGAVSEDDCPTYTHLSKLFGALGDKQKDYNWLITDCECLASDEKLRNSFADSKIVSGEELTNIVRREDFQWIWGVLSGFKKEIPIDEILRYPAPSAERRGLCGVYPSISHPLAQIEITAFDSSRLFFFSRDLSLFRRFAAGYPKCRIMPQPEFK